MRSCRSEASSSATVASFGCSQLGHQLGDDVLAHAVDSVRHLSAERHLLHFAGKGIQPLSLEIFEALAGFQQDADDVCARTITADDETTVGTLLDTNEAERLEIVPCCCAAGQSLRLFTLLDSGD